MMTGSGLRGLSTSRIHEMLLYATLWIRNALRIREFAARDAKECVAWNEATGERLIPLFKDRDYFRSEKIGRAKHVVFVMALVTKDVSSKADGHAVSSEAQPHTVMHTA